MAEPIYFYSRNDPYYELSNFYPQWFEESVGYWPSVEHYFQAMKFSDEGYREKIRTASSPKQAKDLGQTRKIAIASDWDVQRLAVMQYALRRKFEHPKLRDLLLGTKKCALIENSPFDKYWGIGKDGKGDNMLGRLLMELRVELVNDL